jgi:hypothetical protein
MALRPFKQIVRSGKRAADNKPKKRDVNDDLK